MSVEAALGEVASSILLPMMQLSIGATFTLASDSSFAASTLNLHKEGFSSSH